MKTIIALSGKIGCGKDYLNKNYFIPMLKKKNLNTTVHGYADHLKFMSLSTGYCIDNIKNTNNNTYYVPDDFKKNINYDTLFRDKNELSRTVLQTISALEKSKDNDIFLKVIDAKIKLAFDRGADVFIVTDLRFKNEFKMLDALKDKNTNVIKIRINAPNRTYDKMMKEVNNNANKVSIIASHISEVDLDAETKFDYFIRNDYGDYEGVEEIINKIVDTIYM